jgi:hypothetical protein
MAYSYIIEIELDENNLPKIAKQKFQEFIDKYKKHKDLCDLADVKFDIDGDGYIKDVTYIGSGISFRGCETYAIDLSKVLTHGYLRIFFWGENYGDWFGIHIEPDKAYYITPVFVPTRPIEG